jgi:uncharacterized repeat protein (TIGR04076 family)
LGNLRVVVKEVKGKCPVMKPGDYFITCSGKLYIPADRHFCLYALSAVIPFLSGRQPAFDNGDWPKRDNDIICPDPAGNVVMSIEELGD